ncbi:lipid-A-disaccharide synthase [Hydrogenobacter thermophilus]|uniref:lipid-A-disaccharide synthase n=1 Tax=Hydrogenobacter thermophilus TaxID=940 RepID=UPI0030F8A893
MRVFFSLGERSASNYVYNIFKGVEGIDAWGITDERLESLGFKSIAKIEDLSTVGIAEAIPKVPFVLKLYRKIQNLLEDIDVLVLCDAPAFNLPLLKKAKGKVKKIVYFISPQVWAWKENRAKLIAQYADHIIVILPFEVSLYESYGKFKVHYVGHPLVDIAKPSQSRENFFKLVGEQNIVGLLPGSRWSEIKRHASYLRRVFLELHKKYDLFGVLPTFEPFREYLEEVFRDIPVKILTEAHTPTPSYDVMSYSVMSLIASGTAELEASLLLNPHIVFYRVHPLTYFIGKRLIRVKWVSLTNLVLGKEAVSEIIQRDWKMLYESADKLLTSQKVREKMKEDFIRLRHILGEEGVIGKLRSLFLSIFQES